MKLSRRILRRTALALCAVLCTAFISGCASSFHSGFAAGKSNGTGKSNLLDPQNPTTVVVWTYYNGPQKLALDSLLLEYNESVGKELGIAVESISFSNVNELTENVMSAVNEKVGARKVPQIFAAYADTAYQVNKLGFAVNLDEYFTPEELSAYIPGYIAEGRLAPDDKLRIFPTAKSTEVMMLNKTDWDKFAQATGADVAALATMEGVAETAARYYEWTDSLTPEPDDGKAFWGRDAMANYFIVGCKQLGVELLAVQNDDITVNCDKEIMRRLWNSFYVPFVSGHYAANGRFRSDDAKTGDIIALVCSTSGAAFFPSAVDVSETENYPIEAFVLPAPVFEGGQKVAVQQGAGMVVTKGTPAQEYASVQFLKWFTEAERNMRFSTESGYLPVKTEANSIDLLDSTLTQVDPAVLTSGLILALPVAVETTRSYEMYTSRAFEHGTQARAVLEKHLTAFIESDLATLAERITQGEARAQVLAELTSDAHFEEWYTSFAQTLKTAAQA